MMQMSFADLDFPLSAPNNCSNSVSCCRLLSADLYNEQYMVSLLTYLLPSRNEDVVCPTYTGRANVFCYSQLPASLVVAERGRQE